jgi:hypothetical protein
MIRLLLLLAIAAASLTAEVAGNWKATAEGPNGTTTAKWTATT